MTWNKDWSYLLWSSPLLVSLIDRICVVAQRSSRDWAVFFTSEAWKIWQFFFHFSIWVEHCWQVVLWWQFYQWMQQLYSLSSVLWLVFISICKTIACSNIDFIFTLMLQCLACLMTHMLSSEYQRRKPCLVALFTLTVMRWCFTKIRPIVCMLEVLSCWHHNRCMFALLGSPLRGGKFMNMQKFHVGTCQRAAYPNIEGVHFFYCSQSWQAYEVCRRTSQLISALDHDTFLSFGRCCNTICLCSEVSDMV